MVEQPAATSSHPQEAAAVHHPIIRPVQLPPGGSSMNQVVAPPTGGTYLAPEAEFPADLTELALSELHVLHSRVGRQLDREYLSGTSGAHPVTLDRHQELTVELDAREIARPEHAR